MRFPISIILTCLGTVTFAEAPKVATDIAPIHGLVSRVMSGVGTPELIVPPGASPHGYAMRPSEARALAGADVVFWVGPALSPWLEEPIETLAERAEHVTFMDLDGITLLEFRNDDRFEAHVHDHDEAHEGEKDDDHAHDHEDDHGEKHAEHEHENHKDHAHDADHHDADDETDHAHGVGRVDGHLWLDPDNAKVLLSEIATRLSAQDPENAQAYQDNALAAQQEIEALASELLQKLEPVKDRPFIVAHDSYHYFEQHFGVAAAAAVSLSDEGGASAARLAKVKELVAESGARCALAEQRANTGLIEAAAGDVNLTTLDAVGIGISLGPDYYTDLLSQIAEGLVDCLSAN